MKKKTKIVIICGIGAALILAVVGIKQRITVSKEDSAISIIGGADGPTSIFLAGKIGGDDKHFEESFLKMVEVAQSGR